MVASLKEIEMKINDYAKNCELVIGLVGPVGVNLDDVHNRLKSYCNQFHYALNYIHLSILLEQYTDKISGDLQEHERLIQGMNEGNALRKKSERGDLFALIAINEINEKRKSHGNDAALPAPLERTMHVIRSLKHPEEVETLRTVYGHGFFLLGVSSSIESRRKYLHDEKGVLEEAIEDLISRDDKEKDPLGQNTREVFQMADAFITSDSENLSNQISRILDILFGKPVISPTPDEYAMFMAYAASLRSADLSRQVGAVIANEYLDIIATGANDVPKFGGGLYWPDKNDHRDYILKKDSNEEQKNKIVINVMKKISSVEEHLNDQDLLKKGKDLLKETGIFDITEYGRAVHAEMEALLFSARNGISTRNSTLYTTTYPCHNCAKHIVAAGVKYVKYIEPYPKSYASKLHSDSIESNGVKSSAKVIFEPFVGIGPRRFIDLFSMSLGNGRKLIRKENGGLKSWHRKNAELRVPMTPLSYIEAETLLVAELGRIKLKEMQNDEATKQ